MSDIGDHLVSEESKVLESGDLEEEIRALNNGGAGDVLDEEESPVMKDPSPGDNPVSRCTASSSSTDDEMDPSSSDQKTKEESKRSDELGDDSLSKSEAQKEEILSSPSQPESKENDSPDLSPSCPSQPEDKEMDFDKADEMIESPSKVDSYEKDSQESSLSCPSKPEDKEMDSENADEMIESPLKPESKEKDSQDLSLSCPSKPEDKEMDSKNADEVVESPSQLESKYLDDPMKCPSQSEAKEPDPKDLTDLTMTSPSKLSETDDGVKDKASSPEKKSEDLNSSKDEVLLLDSRVPPLSDREWFDSLSPEELDWYRTRGHSPSYFQNQTIQCTGCFNQILHFNQVFRHPTLGVAVCRSCKSYYENGEWTKDEEGYDVYCLWCGNGGDLILCDFCTHSFCKRCLQRNLGRRKMNEISKAEKWKCLLCLPMIIYPQRSMYHAYVQFMAEKTLSKHKKNVKKKQDTLFSNIATSENFLEDNMEEAFKTLNIYQRCLEDERRRWIKCKKRMDLDAAGAIARNLRKIYAITKQNMDLLDADLVQAFTSHFTGVSRSILDVSTGVGNLVTPKQQQQIHHQRRKQRDPSPPPNNTEEFVVNGSPVTAEYHGPQPDEEEEFDPSSLLQVEFRETPAVMLKPSYKLYHNQSASAATTNTPTLKPRAVSKVRPKNNDSEIEVLTLDSDEESSSQPAPKKRKPGPKSRTFYVE